MRSSESDVDPQYVYSIRRATRSSDNVSERRPVCQDSQYSELRGAGEAKRIGLAQRHAAPQSNGAQALSL